MIAPSLTETSGPAGAVPLPEVAAARPRVLIFKDILLPFSETFVLEQSEGCRRFEPHYVGLKRMDGLVTPPDRTVVMHDGTFAGRLEEAAFTRLGIAPRFYARVAKLRPVLIHAHFGPSGMLARSIAGRLRVPLVVQFHGYDATVADEVLATHGCAARQLVRGRLSLQRSSAVFLAVSEFIRGRLIARGIDPAAIRVHYIGVDVARFVPDPSVPREEMVLFVGRLVEKKGVVDVIAAMSVVQERHPSARLVIAGGGPMRETLERQAATSLRNYEFVGRQTPEEVRRWLRRARVFFAPSRTADSGDAEGLGIVFLEAQASGLPVVSTRSGGIPEAVADGQTGFLAAERDVPALAAAVDRLLSDASLRTAFAGAARERMCSRFDIVRQTRELEDLYADVIAGRLDHRRGSRG